MLFFFESITLQFLTNHLPNQLLHIEEGHRGIVIYLRNGIIHIIHSKTDPFYSFLHVFHIDSRMSFLETVDKEGFYIGILLYVLMKSLQTWACPLLLRRQMSSNIGIAQE